MGLIPTCWIGSASCRLMQLRKGRGNIFLSDYKGLQKSCVRPGEGDKQFLLEGALHKEYRNLSKQNPVYAEGRAISNYSSKELLIKKYHHHSKHNPEQRLLH